MLIGSTVLFKVNTAPDIYRPLLVTESGESTVSGVLFFDGGNDKLCEFFTKTLFFFHPDKHTLVVRDKKQGSQVGEWQFSGEVLISTNPKETR